MGGSGGRVDAGSGGAQDDPRPVAPQRGRVEGTDANASSIEGCCSRVSGAAFARACPRGAGVKTFLSEVPLGEWVELSESSPAQIGVPFTVMALASAKDLEVILEETTIDPPSGIVDLSPVYWLWMDERAPLSLPFAVKLPASLDGRYNGAQVYYSADGSVFEPLDDSYRNAGFLEATMPGAGFVVAGAPPDQVECNGSPSGSGGMGGDFAAD